MTPPARTSVWQIGDIRIHRVREVELPAQTGAWLLPDATPQTVADLGWLGEPWVDADGRLRLVSQSFAIEADGRRILVDAGIGNGKPRANPAWHDLRTDFLQRLAAVGFAADDIDLVLLTHLHTDHVGGCTQAVAGAWTPTFAKARHVVARAEWDYWAGTELEPARRQMFEDSVHPLRDAGLVDRVDTGDGPLVVAAGVTLVPSPGHTPGHVAVRIDSAGETALITGDAVHHPVQVARPHLTSCVDIDPAAAVASRRALLAAAHEGRHLVLGTHFPDPVAVRVEGSAGDLRVV